MTTDDQIRAIVQKLNGMLWVTDATEEEVKRLATLLATNEPTDWLNIAVIDHLTDFAEDEQGGAESSGYTEISWGEFEECFNQEPGVFYDILSDDESG